MWKLLYQKLSQKFPRLRRWQQQEATENEETKERNTLNKWTKYKYMEKKYLAKIWVQKVCFWHHSICVLCFSNLLQTQGNFLCRKAKIFTHKMSNRASIKTICTHNKISKKTPPSFISKVVMRVFDGVANIYRNCDISGNRLLLSKNLAKKLLFATFDKFVASP